MNVFPSAVTNWALRGSPVSVNVPANKTLFCCWLVRRCVYAAALAPAYAQEMVCVLVCRERHEP